VPVVTGAGARHSDPVSNPDPPVVAATSPAAGAMSGSVPGRIPQAGSLAAPIGPQVQVWWARVAAGRLDGELRARLAADLDAATLRRLDRFHRVQDRDRGLAGHSLLRRLLAAVAGGAPSELILRTRCAACGKTDHGKPYLDVSHGDAGHPTPPVEVNLSHSGEVVCVALAPAGAQVGVDVEQRRTVDWAALRRSVFADEEWAATERAANPQRRRTEGWTRKEASAKASGHGLALALSAIIVADSAESGWAAALPEGAGWVAGRDVTLSSDVAAAVAIHDLAKPPSLAVPLVRYVTIS
jgi:4'-phosphopantetheinyl transferase